MLKRFDRNTRHIFGAINDPATFRSFIMGGYGNFEIFESRLQLNYKILTGKPVLLFEETSILYYLLAASLSCSAITVNKTIRKKTRTGRRVRSIVSEIVLKRMVVRKCCVRNYFLTSN